MYARVLLAGEGANSRVAEDPRCFQCRRSRTECELYLCVEPMREAWVACLACIRAGVRP